MGNTTSSGRKQAWGMSYMWTGEGYLSKMVNKVVLQTHGKKGEDETAW